MCAKTFTAGEFMYAHVTVELTGGGHAVERRGGSANLQWIKVRLSRDFFEASESPGPRGDS
ncbi:hypothetical protein CFAM422_007214 [Trichoderma lentiforme]|uniref:Uncharacterized protein n=1 Tax=Trichoderma lentiforme TaxID=1567552 RepID=A0A9P4XES0_9HYPO|nr:hypothetical protein CFAM422_007214 [Trichoderma lentiforme]